MNKEFIPYEETLVLLNLGFDEDCVASYRTHNKYKGELDFQYTSSSYLEEENKIKWIKCIKAPLYQQAFRWFREKYDLHPSFTRWQEFNVKFKSDIFPTLYKVLIIDENIKNTKNVGNYNIYEEAELACLRKLIEIVKNK